MEIYDIDRVSWLTEIHSIDWFSASAGDSSCVPTEIFS